MSVATPKFFSRDPVEIGPGGHYGKALPTIPAGDRATRLAWLEQELQNIKQWKTTIPPPGQKSPRSPTEAGSSNDNSPVEGLLSIDSSNSISPAPNFQTTDFGDAESHKARVTTQIMDVITSYGGNERNDSHDLWLGRSSVEPIIRSYVDKNEPIPLNLPAFPWKSINKVDKVIGALPDLGEELALGRLNALCCDIQELYEPGAHMLIISDGLVYADILGIPDEVAYEYGAALRQTALDLEYEHIKFTRIMNLQQLTVTRDVSKEEYLRKVVQSRAVMMEKYLPKDFNSQVAIQEDEDINLTYCGYILFLSKDLVHSPITRDIESNTEYREIVKRVANDMITRGKAFAKLLEDLCPRGVRLSIHRSRGQKKLAIPLIPQKDHFSLTPYHCSVAVNWKGEFLTGYAGALKEHYSLIEKDGRPHHFRDKHEVWNWKGVEFEFFYPKGVSIVAQEEGMRLGRDGLERVKFLGKNFSPVLVFGFQK